MTPPQRARSGPASRIDARIFAHSTGSSALGCTTLASITSVLRAVHSAETPSEMHELDQRLAVANARDVFEGDLLIGEERCGDDRQRGVLVARRMDRAGERASTFDDVAERGGQGISVVGSGDAQTREDARSRMCAGAEECPGPPLQVKEFA